jgi:hypothetical protein
MRSKDILAAIRLWGDAAFIEAFSSTDDDAASIPNADRAHVHRHSVSSSVQQVNVGFSRLSVAHGVGERAGGSAKDRLVLIAVDQNVFAAVASDHILTQVAADVLGTLVPEQNLPIAVNQVHAGLQTFQDSTEDLGILEFRHGNTLFLSALDGKSLRDSPAWGENRRFWIT